MQIANLSQSARLGWSESFHLQFLELFERRMATDL